MQAGVLPPFLAKREIVSFFPFIIPSSSRQPLAEAGALDLVEILWIIIITLTSFQRGTVT